MSWDDLKAGAKDRDIAVAEKAARGRARRLGLLSGLNGEAKAAKFINCDSEIETTKRARGKITRVPFTVSRLMEFCNRRELVNQTGHSDSDWPLVILKELVDNSLDDCEEAEIAPAVSIAVKRGSIVIQDNGRGIPVETIRGILDYGIRVSSREAYVSPTRGAQGNALKTILPMGYVLDERRGEEAAGHTIIEAHGVAHHIRFTVDHIRQEPKIEHNTKPSSINHGTRITVRLPTKIKIYDGSECDYLEERKSEILRLAEAFAWLNPHLSLRLSWNGEKKIDIKASNPAWSKWLPSWPTSPHWYDSGRFKRYMAAHIAHRGGITVRKFISEFDGLSAIAKQKQILAETGVSHVKLHDFFGRDKVNNRKIEKLLAALKTHSTPVPARALGSISKDHLYRLMEDAGGDARTFKYERRLGETNGIPRVVETAFAMYRSDFDARRKLITGVNWSPGVNNPFRYLGRSGEGLDAVLTEARTNTTQPIILVVHVACPWVQYTDRGKSAIVVEGDGE